MLNTTMLPSPASWSELQSLIKRKAELAQTEGGDLKEEVGRLNRQILHLWDRIEPSRQTQEQLELQRSSAIAQLGLSGAGLLKQQLAESQQQELGAKEVPLSGTALPQALSQTASSPKEGGTLRTPADIAALQAKEAMRQAGLAMDRLSASTQPKETELGDSNPTSILDDGLQKKKRRKNRKNASKQHLEVGTEGQGFKTIPHKGKWSLGSVLKWTMWTALFLGMMISVPSGMDLFRSEPTFSEKSFLPGFWA